MEYQQYDPGPLLAEYIKCYWNLDGGPDSSHNKERIFPDGCAELLFEYGDLFKKYTGEHYQIQPRSSIHGQLESYIELENVGRVGIFAVRFKPYGLKPFVRMGGHEFTGRNVSVQDVWGKDGSELEDRMLNARNVRERIAIVETFLMGKLHLPYEQKMMMHCIHLLRTVKGSMAIDRLTSDCNISRRQLERRFVDHVGISPKLLSRIIRFQNTVQLLEQGNFTSLTALGFEAGFYDQAHFIKDFKEFTGLNPRQYFAEHLEMTKFFLVEGS